MKKLLPLALGLALAMPAAACGPDFPMTVLDRRGEILAGLPEGVFAIEAARLVPAPTPAFVLAEADAWADPDEVRARAEGEGLDAAQRETIARMRVAPDPAAAEALGADLPAELRLYTAGALAWHQGDVEGALARFGQVSALPEDQRRLRGVWAAYMEGRALVRMGESDFATAAFVRTRDLAATGAADPAGLAIASLGEEARILLDMGDVVGAVQRYAEQAARGSASGRNSLLFVAREALRSPVQTEALLGDATGRRLVVAFLFARSHELIAPVPADEWPVYDAPPDGPIALALLERLAALPEADLPEPDRLAAVAYRAGRFDLAARIAARSEAPLAAWVQAKLALREGRNADAAAAFARAAQGFPAEESWGEVPLRGGDVWGSETLLPRCRVQAEAGTLALSRGDYLEAMQQLFEASEVYWTDAAHIGERVLTADELKAFVDRVAPQAPAPVAASDEEGWSPPPPSAALRALLARRLVREGRVAEAIPYFDEPEVRTHAEGLAAALRAADKAWTRVGKARAWYEAAGITRWQGLELMGYEGDPDYAQWGGEYDLNSPITWDENWNPVINARSDIKVEGPWTSDDERQRVAASRAQPLERWHYRLVAAGHAGRAGDLLPQRSQAFAAVLCEATSWLIDRHPDPAQQFYRRYLREGAYVPWGEAFGRECPAPNFAKVEAEIRDQWMAKGQRWALWASPLLLLGIGALIWRRRRAAG